MRTILADVGTEDQVGALWLIAFLVRSVIAQLLEDRLRHVGVKVVDEDVLGHIVVAWSTRRQRTTAFKSIEIKLLTPCAT